MFLNSFAFTKIKCIEHYWFDDGFQTYVVSFTITIRNKRSMGHIAHLRNWFKSINSFVESYDDLERRKPIISFFVIKDVLHATYVIMLCKRWTSMISANLFPECMCKKIKNKTFFFLFEINKHQCTNVQRYKSYPVIIIDCAIHLAKSSS